MNEEFAIQLKTVLDNSSVAEVKQQLKELMSSVQKKIVVSAGGSSDGTPRSPRTTVSRDIKEAEARLADLTKGLSLAQGELSKFAPNTTAFEKINAIVEDYKNKIEEVKAAIKEMSGITNDASGNIAKATVNSKQLNNNVKQTSSSTKSLSSNFSSAYKNIRNTLLALIGIRGVYSGIRKAMTSYLAQNTELQSKLNGAWYALGSLFAPVLEYIVNLFIKLVSYVNIFVRALGFAGINMKNYGKAAGAAAKKQKSLLAIDEINNINSQDSGGAGGAADPFKNVKINNKLAQFLEWFGNWLKENLWFVLAVAAGLALWKIGSSLIANAKRLSEIFPAIADFIKPIGQFLQKLGGWILIIAGTIEYLLGWCDALANGVSWDNLTQMILGALAATLGLFIVFGSGASAIGLLVFGIGMIIAGLVEFINTGELSMQAAVAISAGILLIGAAIAIMTGSWIPLLVAAIGAIAIFVGTQWEKIKGTLSKVWEWVKTKVINPIISGLNGLIRGVCNAVNAVADAINSISIKIPDWVPIFGGKTFSPHLGHVSAKQIPLLNTGTNYVPNDMLAQLHEGEAVIPKKFNQNEFFGTATAEELNLLSSINEQLIELNKKDTTINLDGTNVAQTINDRIQELNYRNGERVFAVAR